MSMSPHNYKGIRNRYYNLMNKMELILSPRNVVYFPSYNIDILQEAAALTQEIEMAWKNLEDNSPKNVEYDEMLTNIKSLQKQLADCVKRLSRPRFYNSKS